MKNLIKTKSFWGGAGTIISGVGLIIIGQKNEGLQLILLGFNTIFIRSAIQKAIK